MALTREQKQNILKDLKEKIEEQKSIVFINFKNLKTRDIFDLKKKLKKVDSLLRVAKKTLIELAFKENDIKLDLEKLKGQIAVVFNFKDPISPLKAVYEFSKENEDLEILGGYVEDKEFLEVSKIVELAKLPGRKELLANMMGSMKAPISGLTNVLQGNIKGLIVVLNAIKK